MIASFHPKASLNPKLPPHLAGCQCSHRTVAWINENVKFVYGLLQPTFLKDIQSVNLRYVWNKGLTTEIQIYSPKQSIKSKIKKLL